MMTYFTRDGANLYYEEAGKGTPIIPNAHHATNLDNPEAVNQASAQFLKKQS